MVRALKLVIFDVDGTLVDSQAQILEAMVAAFGRVGRSPPPRDEVLAIVGLSLPEAMVRLCPDLGTATRERLVEGYKASFANSRRASVSPLYPGAAEAVERLSSREDVLLGIATGKSRRGLDHVLSKHGLTRRFQTLQVADNHPSKPNPSMIHAALAETGVASQNAVIVGDTSFDVEMGRAAGVQAVGVAWGYHPEAALRASGAAEVISTFDVLDAALAGLWDDSS